MTIWTAVLTASLTMPLLMRLPPVRLSAPVPTISFVTTPLVEIPPTAAEKTAPAAKPPAPARATPVAKAVDWFAITTAAYLAIDGLLLARLLIGLVLTLHLYRRATPIRADWTEGAHVRVGEHIPAPVTFGRTILLPSDCGGWPAAKRRAVLLHEGSHVTNHDFHIQLLAALNCAVFWFNPFAWWLKSQLIALAETISDNTVLAVTEDRPAYAEILVEIAGKSGPHSMGVAMARPQTLVNRVELILSQSVLPKAVSRRRKIAITLALLPLAGGVACATAETPALSIDNATGGAVDGRLLPVDPEISVANWAAGVIDNEALPPDWPHNVWIVFNGTKWSDSPGSPIGHGALSGCVNLKLADDHIVFSENGKIFMIDDPAIVRQAALTRFGLQSHPELGLQRTELAQQLRAVEQSEHELRTQLEQATSADVRTGLTRQEWELVHQKSALEQKVKDLGKREETLVEQDLRAPSDRRTQQVRARGYTQLKAVIDDAMSRNLAKPVDSSLESGCPPLMWPSNTDFVLVSGNMISSPNPTNEAALIRAWRLRSGIEGDYLWVRHGWNDYYYITDHDLLSRVKALSGTAEDRDNFLRTQERWKAEAQKIWDGRTKDEAALRKEQRSLAGEDDRLRAALSTAAPDKARGSLAKQERDLIAREEVIGRELADFDNLGSWSQKVKNAVGSPPLWPPGDAKIGPLLTEAINQNLAKPAGP